MVSIDLASLFYMGSQTLIIKLVNVIKPFIPDSKWYGLLSVLVGIGLNLLIGMALGIPLLVGVIAGLMVGVLASASYDSSNPSVAPVTLSPDVIAKLLKLLEIADTKPLDALPATPVPDAPKPPAAAALETPKA